MLASLIKAQGSLRRQAGRNDRVEGMLIDRRLGRQAGVEFKGVRALSYPPATYSIIKMSAPHFPSIKSLIARQSLSVLLLSPSS